MNKKNLIIIIAAAVVVVGVVVVFDRWHARIAQAPEGWGAANNSGTPSGAVTQATGTQPSSAGASSTGPRATVTFNRFYEGDSFSFSYPVAWSIYNTSPFSIDNFSGKYDAVGAVPAGGAEIDVVTTTLYSTVRNIMTTELTGATNVSTNTIAVSGVSCTEARYNTTYPGNIASKNVAVYCARSSASSAYPELWKIYLSYRAGDSAASAHTADFSTILSSMKFLP